MLKINFFGFSLPASNENSNDSVTSSNSLLRRLDSCDDQRMQLCFMCEGGVGGTEVSNVFDGGDGGGGDDQAEAEDCSDEAEAECCQKAEVEGGGDEAKDGSSDESEDGGGHGDDGTGAGDGSDCSGGGGGGDGLAGQVLRGRERLDRLALAAACVQASETNCTGNTENYAGGRRLRRGGGAAAAASENFRTHNIVTISYNIVSSQ
jgi:hypothetical protein